MRDFELPAGVTIRHDLRPGDVGTLVAMHDTIYAKECGFDQSFSAYVEGPLTQFAHSRTSRERVWIAECAGRIVGCVAIVDGGAKAAQLRWFLVDPTMRGRGLGRRLLSDAMQFAKDAGYESAFLWTISALPIAAHLYQAAGFRKVEEKPGHWGVDVTEEKYAVHFGSR